MKIPLVALPLALLAAGCCTIERSSRYPVGDYAHGTAKGRIAEHVHVSNYGYYLFNHYPLFCGDTRPGRVGKTRFFGGEVDVQGVASALFEEVGERRGRISEIQPKTYSTCFFSCIPYVGNSLGILWYREAQLSAVLVVQPPQPPQRKGARK